MKGNAPLLRVDTLTKSFGGLTVVRDVSFDVHAGSRTALVGPNGAGKTVLFNLVSGAYQATSGRVMLASQDITAMPVHRRIPLGLGRTFQNIRLMPY